MTTGKYTSLFFSSFVDQIVSLLHNPKTMEKIIKDCDIFTVKCGNDFWDPTTINYENSMVVPVPLDTDRDISDITPGYLFQWAISCFCTAPNYMPVPISIGYDTSNPSQQGSCHNYLHIRRHKSSLLSSDQLLALPWLCSQIIRWCK